MTEGTSVGSVGRNACERAASDGGFVGLRYALAQPLDSAWPAAFRILSGLTLCVSMLRFRGYGWVDAFFVTPEFHFKYYGFAGVESLARIAMHGLSCGLAVLALAIACGALYRVAAALFAGGFIYLQLVDVPNYLNHFYFADLLAGLFAISPAHRALSIDAHLRPAVRSATDGAVWLWPFQAQVAVVCTFAGFAKAHANWLLDAHPLRIWLAERTDTPLIGSLLGYEESAYG